jgi:hypothetical protein
VVPETVYLPASSAASEAAPTAATPSEAAPAEVTAQAPAQTVHVTATTIALVTVYPTSSSAENTVATDAIQALPTVETQPAQTTQAAEIPSITNAGVAATTAPDQGLLSVIPVTPSGFITITETTTQTTTETKTVTDRITETVTATVTRN